MAEIRVPACPIPIHHTKLTIANPHPIGILMPQIPTPLMISQASARVSSITRLNVTVNPAIQPRDAGRVRTIALILSVTVRYVWPGSITGDSLRISGELRGGSPTLMPSPNRNSDCVPLLGTSYADENSVH